MLSVYEINSQTNTFQQLEYDEWPAFDAVYDTEDEFFTGKPIAKRWNAPEVYVRKPMLRVPNIWQGPDVAFTFDEQAVAVLRPILERAGELLPLPFEGRTLFTLNPTTIVDCLDLGKSEYDPVAPFLIDKFEFDSDKFGPSLFIIPQRMASSLLTVDGLREAEREFKALVEKHGLSGVWFRPWWSSDDK